MGDGASRWCRVQRQTVYPDDYRVRVRFALYNGISLVFVGCPSDQVDIRLSDLGLKPLNLVEFGAETAGLQ